MKAEDITMSQRELQRLSVIRHVVEKRLTQKKAGEALGLSTRQVRRMQRRVEREGERGIIHRLRGKASACRIHERTRERVIRLYRERYGDFGPTLACEKLQEEYGIQISRESLRQWLIEDGAWSRKRNGRAHRQFRERKSCFGEMLQMDGSHHDWLEGRGPKLVLMGYIDDATGKAFGRFSDYEGTFPAMDGFHRYIRLYGIPQSVYLDKHSTYKSSKKPQTAWEQEEWENGRYQSQFERASRELGVRVIHAHSPQAKGRVERFFLTQQDRLVKEMRLAGISTKDQANAFLVGYWRKHNLRFSVPAADATDLHRPLSVEVNLESIFCIKTARRLCNDMTIQFQGERYQILDPTTARTVQVRQTMTGKLLITTATRKILRYRLLRLASAPRIVPHLRLQNPPIPAPDHPWRRFTLSHQGCISPR